MISERRRPVGGFTLVEVLIALVVLGFGLLGLTRLQGHIMKSGADAKARSVAVTLAQRKMDDLRRYTELTPLAAGADAYSQVTDNGGGSIAAGTITRSGVAYRLSWDVTDYYYGGFNTAASQTPPSPVPNFPAFKSLTITVAWQDEAGVARQVQLDSVLAPVDPRRSSLVANATGTLFTSPGP